MDSDTLLPFTLPANETVQFWVTVDIPKDLPAGKYKAALRTTKGPVLALTIDVLPFALPPPPLEYSIYYRGKLSPHDGTVSSEYKNAQQLSADLANIRRHGITNPTVYQRFRPKFPRDGRSDREAQRLLKEALATRQAQGLTSPDLYYLGRTTSNPTSPAELAQLERDVRAVTKIAAGHGYRNTFFYGIDEASGDILSSQRMAWSIVRSSGGRIFTAGRIDALADMGDLLDALVYQGLPSAELRSQAHATAANVRMLSYDNPQSGPENPAVFRLNYGLRLWQSGFDGAMIYAFQHSMGNIWDDLDHPIYRDHALTYPTVDRPLDTLAWEGLREGIVDTQYVGAVESKASSCRSDAGLRARRYLTQLRDSVIVDPASVRSELIDLALAMSPNC
ncbi:MAG: hypothetical protein JNM50_06915 [Chromatiales bacterium]|nr:hypothetical protein [Chromatiales bacterium]